MAVTEPRQTTQPVGGPPPVGGPAEGGRRRGRWRGWLFAGLAVLLAVAFVVLAVLAGTYQPIQFGGESGGAFPGLPTADFHSVNTYGDQTGQDYLPPQLGAFTVVESIANTGPEAVTIVAVSMEDPQQSAVGVPPWPLTPAGPVLGTLEQFTAAPVPVHKVAGFSLAPGQTLRIAIPVRLSGTCYDKGSWSEVSDFYVEERFLTVTHWVTVAMPIPLMFRQPANPGTEPAKDLTCLARH